MYLDVELCDLQQNVLTRLDRRKPGLNVDLGLNAARRGECILALDDPALALAKSLTTVLRVTLKGPGEFSRPLLIGRVIIPERVRSAEAQTLALKAADPLFHVERKLIRSEVGSVWNPRTFATTDQSQIMWALISAFSDHGIAEGSLPASVNRDRTYAPSKEVGPALVEMAEVIGGPDFELAPVIAGDGTLVEFNTFYPRQGADLTDSVVFECGGGRETAVGLTHSPGGEEVCNRFLAIGAPRDQEGEAPYAMHPAYLAEHLDSIDDLQGAFERREQFDDVTETATLEAHAKAAVAAAAYPVDFFDFTAAPEQYEDETGDGVPPRFGVDYWLGDTITVLDYDIDADEPLELTGRVTDAKITERESGQIDVKVTCSPEVSSTGVTGKALEVKVPEGE
jgi:hypothetical protein